MTGNGMACDPNRSAVPANAALYDAAVTRDSVDGAASAFATVARYGRGP